MFVQNMHVVMSKWLQFKPIETLKKVKNDHLQPQFKNELFHIMIYFTSETLKFAITMIWLYELCRICFNIFTSSGSFKILA